MKKFIYLCSLLMCLNVCVSADEVVLKPADGMIKAAQNDLAKYEKQAKGIAPGNKNSVNRITRFLPMIKGRLASSKNKTDPSWVQTNKRLEVLIATLAALKDGKKAPAAKVKDVQKKGSSNMTDPEIAKKYNADYNALRNELKPLRGPDYANAATVSKYQARFVTLNKLVNSYKDPTLPYAVQSKKYVAALEKWFNNYVNKYKSAGTSKPTAKTTAKPADASAPLDYMNKRALMFFEKDYDRYAVNFKTVDPTKVDQLTGNIKALETRYSKFTATNHAKVIDARKRLDALKKKLDDPSVAAAVAKNKAEAERLSKIVKLDYRQSSALASGVGRVKSVGEDLEKYKKVTVLKDAPKPGLSLIRELDIILKRMKDDGVPEDNETYIETKKKAAALKVAILVEEKRHIAMFEKTDKVASIKHYKNYKKDMEILATLWKKYNESKVFGQGNESLAKVLMATHPTELKKYDAIAATYKPFVDVNVEPYKAGYRDKEIIVRALRNAGGSMKSFVRQQKEFLGNEANNLEKEIASLEVKLAKDVKDKNVAHLSHGLAHQEGFARTRLNTFATILGEGHASVKKVQAKFNAFSTKLKAARDSMKEEILAAQMVPADVYAGEDKADIIKKSIAEWNKKHPSHPILKSGIAMEKWSRRTEWRSSAGSLYKVDMSYIQVYIIVKTNDKIATKYIIDINKNHMKNNSTSYYSPKDLTSNRIFKTEMLLKNVK